MTALQNVSDFQRAVSNIETVEDGASLRADGEAIYQWVRSHKLGTFEANTVMKNLMLLECKLGRMLDEVAPHGGDRKSSSSDSNLKTLEELGISPWLSSSWKKMAEVGEQNIETYFDHCGDEQLMTRSYLFKLLTESTHVSHNSGNNEWYTPPEYIEAARGAMGNIDLDPASSSKANQIIRADNYYTADDDGLSQDWGGNVWMNPPYSQPEIGYFAEKLISELDNIESACVLVNNATETKWLQSLLLRAKAVCFISGRISYLDTKLQPANKPLQGQIVLYFGNQPDRFFSAFSIYGVVYANVAR